MRKAFGLLALIVAAVVMLTTAYGSFVSNDTGYSDKDLSRLAQENNRDYFDNKLPKDMYVHWADIPRENKVEVIEGRTYYLRNPVEILIDRRSNVTGDQAALTLLHEECHVYAHTNGTLKSDDMHGKEFQVCMKNLALQGAMEGLW